jgi:hypothetical protein
VLVDLVRANEVKDKFRQCEIARLKICCKKLDLFTSYFYEDNVFTNQSCRLPDLCML